MDLRVTIIWHFGSNSTNLDMINSKISSLIT